jgi:hypothetical protein
VLELNIKVLTTLSREATQRQGVDSSTAAKRYEVFAKTIQNCLDDHAFIHGHVGLVRKRAERIAVMVSSSKATWKDT